MSFTHERTRIFRFESGIERTRSSCSLTFGSSHAARNIVMNVSISPTDLGARAVTVVVVRSD
jgi:hypothetical protein